MKFLRIDLRAFGPFTDLVLPLDAGSHGMHILYGPNEAGKSSSLRAIEQLLFGFPERTTDNFLHGYKKLRIGARLLHSDGSELELIRRKAHKHPLLAADDKTPIEAGQLRHFLGKIDQGLFASMFGLNRETLERGGKEILLGGGQLGQLLFAAGSGIADLRRVQDRLQTELDELYLPRGQKQKINAHLTELQAAREKVRTLQLSSDLWLRHDQNLSDAQKRRQHLQQEADRVERELRRLTRMRDALPALARRKELLRELREYRNAVHLPDDFSRHRLAAQTARREAEVKLETARQQLERIEKELAQVQVPAEVLADAERIEALYQEKASIDKACKDRAPNLRSQLNHEHRAREIWKSLGRDGDMIGEVESLRLRPDEPELIRQHGHQNQRLLANLDNAQTRIDKQEREIASCKSALQTLPDSRDMSELRRLVMRIQKLGPLEENLQKTEQQIAKLRRQSAQTRTRLRLGDDAGDDLPRLPMPSLETLDRFHQEFQKIEQKIQGLRQNRDNLAAELDRIETQRKQLDLQHDLPSEEELKKSRRRRQELWRVIRHAWKNGAETIPLETLKHYGTTDLSEAYESSVLEADQLVDRLRREAERVARNLELSVQQDRHQANLETISGQLTDNEAEAERMRLAWRKLWQPLGIAALTPAEMRVTVNLFHEAVQLLQQIQLYEDEAETQRQRIHTLNRQLSALFDPDESGFAKADSLTELVEFGLGLLQEEEKRSRQKQKLEDRLADAGKELTEARRERERAEAALARWQSDWSEHMKRLVLPATLAPDSASKCLEEIQKLWTELDHASVLRSRIRGIDNDKEKFDRQIGALTKRLLPGVEHDGDRAAADLHRHLNQARTDQQKKETLQRQKLDWQAKAQDAQTALRTEQAILETLREQAGAAAVQDLPGIEERSRKRSTLERELEQRDSELLKLRAGASLEEFEAAVSQTDEDRIDLDSNRLAQEQQNLRDQLKEVDQTIGSERTELARMDGSAEAAEAAQRVEEIAERMREDLRAYAVLRISSGILKKGIEQYRQKNEGPILQRASELFALLTNGSFSGLRVEQNHAEESELVGVRDKEKQVNLAGLSDGSRDQLYLALRLASLEVFLQSHEPIPFIVDDLLLNFDDARAIAALKALAELSRKTQVLFFTHHRHLVELAREHLPGGVAFVHELRSKT